MRVTIIDGFRGIFLVFMVIIHADEILKTTIGKLNHHYFGWVEDAQGFVFMSGIVVGLVYGGRYLKHSYQVMQKAIFSRIRTIYSHQLFLILVFLAAALLFVLMGDSTPNWLDSYERNPILFPALSAMLVTGSAHMGILPMYIFFMMATPPALRLLVQRRYTTYAVIVASCWVVAQTRLPDYFVGVAEDMFAESGHPLNLGIFFNILGWQTLFFGGLMIGFLMAAKRLSTEFLFKSEMRTIFLICAAFFFFFGIYDRIVFDDWFGTAFSDAIKAETDRGNFSIIYPITFLVDLVVVVWLLGPGMSDQNRLIRGSAMLLNWFVTLRPLVFLGQHSLHVFSAHILLVYVLAAIYQKGPPSELVGTLLIFLCVGLLFVVAWLHTKSLERAKALRAG